MLKKNTLKNYQTETFIEKSKDVKIAKGMSAWIHGKHMSGKTILAIDLLKNLYLQYEEIYCSENLLDIETYVSMKKVKKVRNLDVSSVLHTLIKKQKQFLIDNPTKQHNENVLFVIDDLELDEFPIVMKMLEDAKKFRIDLIITSALNLGDYQEQFFDCLFNPMQLMFFDDTLQNSHQYRNVRKFGGKNQFKDSSNFNELIKQYQTDRFEWICILKKKYNEKLYSYIPQQNLKKCL